ncbi:hypothetical protein CSA80_00590 [Candidatus Saccharibacteria bacterium]|nr:MAG: hypothetical protein CSA80_00590 [Candidatus Saccharibacteria bacterium]
MDDSSETQPRNEEQPNRAVDIAAPDDIDQGAPAQPVVAAASDVAPKSEQQTHSSSSGSGILVLQWLTYAFWGWFGFAIGWLATVVASYFISPNSTSDWSGVLAYPLAAVLILFVIAFTTDLLYSRHEPTKKSGAANVIMLLHVVPFVLIAIGGVIVVVFSLISMILNSGTRLDNDDPMTVLYAALVIAITFGVLAVRVFFGSEHPTRRQYARSALGLIALVGIIVSLVGPVALAINTKDDRLIERVVVQLSDNVRSYAQDNDKLPVTLKDAGYDGSKVSEKVVREVVDKQSVTYKPNMQPSDQLASSLKLVTINNNDGANNLKDALSEINKRNATGRNKYFYYQLCTTYKKERKGSDSNTKNGVAKPARGGVGTKSDYSSSVSAGDPHPAGDVCYNLSVYRSTN